MCHESDDDDDAAVDDDEAAAVATLLITLLLLFFLIRSFLFCFLNLWGLLLVYCAEIHPMLATPRHHHHHRGQQGLCVTHVTMADV